MGFFPAINFPKFLSWRTKLTFHHNQEPISLHSTSTDGDNTITLSDFARLAIPPCLLNPFLFNGHLQTIWTTFDTSTPELVYKRKTFDSDSQSLPGTFVVDFSVGKDSKKKDELNNGALHKLSPRTTYLTDVELQYLSSQDDRPMLIVLHGLGGGSNEAYVRRVIAPFLDCLDETWEVCVVNGRGCARHQITTPFLYNARNTSDVRQCIRWLTRQFPKRKLFGVGLSLGANILANYLAEEGDRGPLKAAVLCSNPWYLGACNEMLQGTWIGRTVYSPALGHSIKRLFEHNVEQVSKIQGIDIEMVRREVKHLFEFDREVQVPSLGYQSYMAYYEDASSVKSVVSIRTPTLILTVEDDPIALMNAVPVQDIRRNPFLCLLATSDGGHLGWFEWGGGRFFVTAIYQFLRRMASETDGIVEKMHTQDSSSISQVGDEASQTIRKRVAASLAQ